MFAAVPQLISPELFAQITQGAEAAKVTAGELARAQVTLVKLVLHTGKDLEQLVAADLLEFRAWNHRSGRTPKGLHAAWDLLRGAGVLPADTSLRDQDKLFGSVASDATAWRVVDRVDAAHLAGLQTVRAAARERAWAAGAEPDVAAGLVIDLDATPMRGLSRFGSAAVIAVGHALVQNLRRGHYELATEVSPPLRLATAFGELALAM